MEAIEHPRPRPATHGNALNVDTGGCHASLFLAGIHNGRLAQQII